MNAVVLLAGCSGEPADAAASALGPSPCPPDPDLHALHVSVSDTDLNFHIFAEVWVSFEDGEPQLAECSVFVREGTCLRWDILGDSGHYDLAVSAPGLDDAEWSVDVAVDETGAIVPQSRGFRLPLSD